jgi:hypothetical protein
MRRHLTATKRAQPGRSAIHCARRESSTTDRSCASSTITAAGSEYAFERHARIEDSTSAAASAFPRRAASSRSNPSPKHADKTPAKQSPAPIVSLGWAFTGSIAMTSLARTTGAPLAPAVRTAERLYRAKLAASSYTCSGGVSPRCATIRCASAALKMIGSAILTTAGSMFAPELRFRSLCTSP